MAKRLFQLKGYVVKEATDKERAYNPNISNILIYKDGEIDWDCETVELAREWILSQD